MIGIGLDTVDVARFRRVLARRPGLADRVFTAREKADMAGRADPVPGLAARFAAKEATMKALGVGIGAVRLGEIGVVRAPSGAPSLETTGLAAARVAALGVGVFRVSLTHTGTHAGAVVVAE
ncbi:MAG TPA: holo-ACP synthase [Acidimicrobiales bacterium]|nr:holo-ACP synthase [Acidimicrobiales bacterium]